MMQINIEKQSPAILEKTADGFFADFALAAFGRLAYEIEADEPCKVEMAIGEVLAAPGKIEREPGGYRCIKVAEVELQKGVNRGFMFIKKHRSPYQDDYQRSKVLTPENAGGEIAPFRYAEVKGKVKSVKFTRHALFAPFDDDAAQFSCADERLNKVWEFCKYSMKATSCFGIYVDGDRERQAFEGDCYINALGAYCTGGGYEVARRTLDFMISFYPIPAMEYRLFTPILVRDYFLYSGDTDIYRYWKSDMPEKFMPSYMSEDGLYHYPERFEAMHPALKEMKLYYQYFEMFPDNSQLLIDWPWEERDGYEFNELNLVPHAFLYGAYQAMNDLEPGCGYDAKAAKLQGDIMRLFRRADGRYCDNSVSEHMAVHSAMFAVAWGAADKKDYPFLADFMQKKGMACSVYGAQFLLDACFMTGAAQHAIELMRADNDRSWLGMMRQGSTISMEAWNNAAKPNQDWNHAWGAAPANVIPRRLVGIRPIANGFKKFVFDPQPGDIAEFYMKHPTPQGSVIAEYSNGKAQLTVPEGTEALCGGKSYAAGKHTITLK